MKKMSLTVFLALVFLLAACGPAAQPPASTAAPTAYPAPGETAYPGYPGPVLATAEPAQGNVVYPAPGEIPTPGGAAYPAPGAGLPLPENFNPLRTALAQMLITPEDEIVLQRLEPREFRDGCLEVAPPDVMCTQAIVPGYRVFFRAPQGIYAFHTDEMGSQFAFAAERPARGAEPSVYWERSGGIAGICRSLAIYPLGAYVLTDCASQMALAQGMLDFDQRQPVMDLLLEYKPLTWQAEIPAGAADMFADRYTFNGQGGTTMPPDLQAQFNEQMAQLASLLTPRLAGPGEGTLEVYTTLGPTCPVVVAGAECEDQPYQVDLEVQDASGQLVAILQGDIWGYSRIVLPAGTYTLVPPAAQRFPRASPMQVTVIEGQLVSVDFQFDTGLR